MRTDKMWAMKSLAAISLSLLLCATTHAATSGQALTPVNVSVLGNETKTFSVRFTDAAGRPAVGETVQFLNDACGWFANNSAVANVRTDANGIASTPFTAYNQGITCWLIAVATPAQVQFNVLTYTRAQVYMTASLDPLKPRPGSPSGSRARSWRAHTSSMTRT
jgi:Bacterial Ig-like domain (group 1).